MPRKTRALSGAAQDAYFRRVLKTCPSLSAEERDHVVQRLRQEIAQLRLRVVAVADPPETAESLRPPAHSGDPNQPPVVESEPAADPPFDPYSPNVIVVLRKSGREAALSALSAIESLDNLRLLAREQRLSVSAELSSPAEVRAAIVAAAERRVANRLAAAS